MLMKLALGVDFINILRAAFTSADPESAKKTVKLSFFFELAGSANVDFTNILRVAFVHVDPKSAKMTDDVSAFYAFGI